MNKNINFFDTYISKEAYSNVKAVLDSTRLSEGKLVKKFEESLEKELGIINAVSVNSGTSSLHLALVLAGVGPGDEVILPAQTFVASGLVITQQGATPVFADIKYETGNIDPISVRENITEKTKAIMVVHWGGLPVDLDEINKIAKEYNLIVIEDAAHAIGALYKSKPIGSISDYTCFSFQAIKHLTTGDGGAICTKNSTKYKEAKAFRWFGIDRETAEPSILGERKYDIPKVGYKYHLNDYAAALGLSNLPSLKKRIEKRQEIANQYRTGLSEVSGIKLFDTPGDRESAHWLFGIHVENRESFIKKLSEASIPTSVVHLGIDHNSVFGSGIRQDLVMQRKFDNTQIHLPMHDYIDTETVEYIIEKIKLGW